MLEILKIVSSRGRKLRQWQTLNAGSLDEALDPELRREI